MKYFVRSQTYQMLQYFCCQCQDYLNCTRDLVHKPKPNELFRPKNEKNIFQDIILDKWNKFYISMVLYRGSPYNVEDGFLFQLYQFFYFENL